MATRPRRQHANRAQYNEVSDSEEVSGPSLRRTQSRPNYLVDNSSDSDPALSQVATSEPIRKPSTRGMPTRSHLNKRKTHTEPYSSYKRQKTVGRPLKKTQPSNFIPPDGKRLPWPSLEHSILTEILKFASYPLYSDYVRPNASIKWLIKMSYLSKSFHDAAISTLLFCPPLAGGYASGFTHLLEHDQSRLFTNYRVKIRHLVVEAKHLLARKGAIANLADLVACTPLLESLRIVSHYDEISAIWAHTSAAKRTYVYEPSLFQALDDSCPRLQSFEFNGRFGPGTGRVIDMMATAGEHHVFQNLTSITLMNLNLPEKATAENRTLQERQLLAALDKVSSLTKLEIINCDALNNFAGIATLQTTELKSLTIKECLSLTSIGLEEFLSTKGQHLKQLSLVGNQSCDGSWLPGLPQYCPALQVLRIDLTFKDVTSYNETTPFFDDFLPAGAISFPSSLIEIEITNLRKVDSAQLEACLESLINAPLPSIRRICLKAILTISDYRVRAAIRNEWRHRLERRFLRRSAPPLPVRTVAPVRQSELKNISSAASTSNESRHRKSSRISWSIPTDDSSTNDKDIQKGYQSIIKQEALCDIVDFRVDDQRPAESQYQEQDFLDGGELSGDEDYCEGREVGEHSLWGY